MNFNDINIEPIWQKKIARILKDNSFYNLKKFLINEKKNQIIYPKCNKIFAAFNLCPFKKVKVVLIGQDPYHGLKQANGLCFSVSDKIKLPPSLINIFKELGRDINIKPPKSGNLEHWAKQGILLLNTVLTVRAKQPGSHKNKGWEKFTDSIIEILSSEKKDLIFLLWGRIAQEKAKIIDTKKHYILTAAHPSPFSAHSGFFGCKHFSKTNELLKKLNKKPIKWGK